MMKLTIYMKSGNQITVDGVEDWRIKYNNQQITLFELKQSESTFIRPVKKLIVGSLDLKSIECVVQH